MPLKTPSFWYKRHAGILPYFLLPFGCLYSLGARMHESIKEPQKAPVPVLCIGNLTAGGSGKTPVAIEVMRLIKDKGLAQTPHFLSRGYGGEMGGPVLADVQKHTSGDIGDEVFLLSQQAPVVISVDRAEGANLIHRKGGDLAVMDDGLQNYDLLQDVRLLVINGAMGLGNGKVIPAGPLRESKRKGFSKADGFVFIGEDQTGLKASLPSDKPVFQAQMISTIPQEAHQHDVFAFAGLGWNEKFFDSLRAAGIKVKGTASFADHHVYTEHDIETLISKSQGATLVTTEKDFVRIPQAFQPQILSAGVRVSFDDPENLLSFIQSKLGS